MTRNDLLALTADDLATMANRGTVKRAQKELESGEFTFELTDESGELTFAWSDGTTCRFPAGKTVHEAVCSSGSIGISRHIVRSVLAYQNHRSDASAPAANDDSPDVQAEDRTHGPATLGPWDPGTFTDDDLEACFRKAPVAKARQRFERGVLVELTRGAKPTAKFLDEPCTVRFLVPGDLRYVSADCAESLLPLWVPMAVWAFRHLPEDKAAGLVSLQQADLPVPVGVLNDLETSLGDLCRDGFAGVGDPWATRVSRIEESLRNEGLIWPADLVADLLEQRSSYKTHDARFDPLESVRIVGELIARRRAIGRQTKHVPQMLIRGSRSDRPVEIASGRMIGMGVGVRSGKRNATLSAYLVDVDSGTVVAVERTFSDPDPQTGDRPRSFSDLAATAVVRGVSIAGLASSQLLIKSGKRTPAGLLILPRTVSSIATNPQSYQWEAIKPPFFAEGFAQLMARFAALPPTWLRPRRRTDDLHVVRVHSVENVVFDAAHQRLTAILTDAEGNSALLVHPFLARGADGFDHLADALRLHGSQVRFVCGHVRPAGKSLEIRPVSIVIDDGTNRRAILPWVRDTKSTAMGDEGPADTSAGDPSPIDEFLRKLIDSLGDSLITGLASQSPRTWQELVRLGQQTGFSRLTHPAAKIADRLNARAGDLHWDGSPAALCLLELCLYSRIAMD